MDKPVCGHSVHRIGQVVSFADWMIRRVVSSQGYLSNHYGRFGLVVLNVISDIFTL